MGIITSIGFSILIILLCNEMFYLNFSHSFYAIFGALILKFAVAINARRMLDKINRDYPKEEKF